MRIYGLQSYGHSVCGWPFKAQSVRMFLFRFQAERFIPEFRKLCFDETKFDHAVDAAETPLTVKIVERNLRLWMKA